MNNHPKLWCGLTVVLLLSTVGCSLFEQVEGSVQSSWEEADAGMQEMGSSSRMDAGMDLVETPDLPATLEEMGDDLGPDLRADLHEMPDMSPDMSIDMPPDMLMDMGKPRCCPAQPLRLEPDPRASFYQLDRNDDGQPAVFVDLQNAGFCVGERLRLRAFGQWDACMHMPCPRTDWVAVFSASDVLLAKDQRERLPDALACDAEGYDSGVTYQDKLETDIPQDFRVRPLGVDVTVPPQADWLVIAAPDSSYDDNHSPMPSGVYVDCAP